MVWLRLALSFYQKIKKIQPFFEVTLICTIMGLILMLSFCRRSNIRRIVFSSMEKFDGKRMSTLSSSQVKQIAGRAGRYGTEYSAGLVTT